MIPLPILEFMAASAETPVVDVRSPGEFEKGHIPGAFNIPLFTNEERAQVGTVYKQTSREEAILLGLKLVGPKLADFVTAVSALAPAKQVLVHCWRGGMRSSSFAWLLNTAGIKTRTLQRGYKAYREYVRDTFSHTFPLVIVGGETGSGKTEILQHLKILGEQVIDLEALAHHKGSSFGALGQKNQPAVEAFENVFAQELRKMDLSRRIWLEDESKNIGRVFIPDAFWLQMKQAPILRVELPKAERINRLLAEYGTFETDALRAAIVRIEKRLGGLIARECLDALDAGDLHTVADRTLSYYDKAYNFNHEKREMKHNIIRIPLSVNSPSTAADLLLAAANQKLSPHGTLRD